MSAIGSNYSVYSPGDVITTPRPKRDNGMKADGPKGVILGAGPAGLMHAIMALTYGNEVEVLEKRSENHPERNHVVTITEDSRKVLEEYGIYQVLSQKQLLGPPSVPAFSFCVRIGDLEDAMKEMISALSPDKQVIFYDSELDAIKSSGALVIKVDSTAKRILKAPDYLLVAEGVKSNTFTKLLGGKRIIALPASLGIGGIFKRTVNKSFISANKTHPSASGVVLSTANQLYVARGTTPQEQTVLASLKTKEEKNQYIAKQLQTEVYEDSEPFTVYDAPEEIVMVDQACLQTSFASHVCGKLSAKTLYFITGDARLEVDITLGSGCNNVIGSAGPLIASLQNRSDPDAILNTYAESSKELISSKLSKAYCVRSNNQLPYDEQQYDEAKFRLKNSSLIYSPPQSSCVIS